MHIMRLVFIDPLDGVKYDQSAVRVNRNYVLWISVIFVFIIGSLDFVGWISGSYLINSHSSHPVNMKGITSIGFLLTSIALSVIIIRRPAAIKTSVPQIIGVLLILVSLISILCSLNFKISGNEFTFTSFRVLNRIFAPEERMAVITGIDFFIVGLILILLSLDQPAASDIAHIIFLPVAVSGFIIPVSHLLNSYSFYKFFNSTAALNSGIAFFFLCIAVFFLKPDTRLMKVFTDRNTGGIMARRLLPWFALLPVAGSWLKTRGIASGLITSESGILIGTIVYSFGFISLIWVTARSVIRIDKKAKDKLNMALENGKIGIWEWEINNDIFVIDERMEKIMDIPPGTFENNYYAFEKNIHEEDLPHVRSAIRQALENDIPLKTIFRIRHHDAINYISTRATVEKNNKMHPVKMSGVCFDITEMKMGAEKALFTLNEELLRSNKELEQFAYVASHDLQEPLRTVSNFTQLLAQRYQDKLDQDAKDFIQFTVEGADRMQVMINGLLDYSRIGTKGEKFVHVDMKDVLNHVIINLNTTIKEKKALVTSENLPVVIADSRQMIQLLQNIVGNSLKFCKSIPKIHISAREEPDKYTFSVRDNGIGIDNQYFDKLFKIFQRLHTRDEYGGTGIGLAICKRIIERHGGKIWVESKPGEGSVFYFTIIKR
jgi:signal transduction histidine kinase